MALHAFVEYIKYARKAKGRHGVHSPFVYDLIEDVLLNKDIINRAFRVDCPGIPLKYENLISRIAAYYNFRSVLQLPATDTASVSALDMLLLNEIHPNEWASLINNYSGLLKNDSAVVITGVHKGIEHSSAWKKISADEKIRLSIDVYGLGLLFFKNEFKEKQHFILKY